MRKIFKLIFCTALFYLVFQSTCLTASDFRDTLTHSAGISPRTTPELTIDVGSRLELFIDDYLIEKFVGKAELRLHHPKPKEIVFKFDAPWEGSGSGYVSIFQDGDAYKMYYKAWQHESGVFADRGIRCCYAESTDGIHWQRPNLGLYEFNGSKNNNIVFINGIMDGIDADGGHPAVFKDENPNVEPDARYKAILVSWKSNPRGLVVFKSSDGIHWSSLAKAPVITDGAFDSQNLAFWDSVNKEYRAYWRTFIKVPEGTDKNTSQDVAPGFIRSIRTAVSNDMINWSNQKDLIFTPSSPTQLYTNAIKPYYRAPHIFIGFPMRYIDRGWSESMLALPELSHRKIRADYSQRIGTTITDGLFMTSRDGVTFKRWDEAFLRPGLEREGTWNYGHQLIAWSIVETASSIEDAPKELSLYAIEDYMTGISCNLRRYTLRVDGFVSVNAPMDGGEIITKPIVFNGKNLIINFSSSAAGDIKVELQDKNGKPIPGFSLEECPPIFGDSLARKVTWESGKDLSSLKGKMVRVRFIIKDSDLYSFLFQ
ncbi:MAG: hypothetical protein ACOX19_04475 [Fermentimonas sp.]